MGSFCTFFCDKEVKFDRYELWNQANFLSMTLTQNFGWSSAESFQIVRSHQAWRGCCISKSNHHGAIWYHNILDEKVYHEPFVWGTYLGVWISHMYFVFTTNFQPRCSFLNDWYFLKKIVPRLWQYWLSGFRERDTKSTYSKEIMPNVTRYYVKIQ